MRSVADVLRAEIAASGPISFAQFMAKALYCPELGYYDRFPNRLGAQGDYYTSVGVGSLFGALLASRIDRWATQEGLGQVDLVEAGAHDGRLGLDILTAWAGAHGGRLDGVSYWIVEPSPVRQGWQRTTLAGFGERVRWVTGLEVLPERSLRGVCFSNELLDAFPVHRLGWAAGERRWFEWGVGMGGEGFQWVRLADVAGAARLAADLPSVPAALAALLPDGFSVEVCPAAREWWAVAAGRLEQGRLVTFDYGLEAEEFLHPSRSEGTLRGYRAHQLIRDVLESPGDQDLTAHVNFTAIRRAGEEAGLVTEEDTSQARFLTQIASTLGPETWLDRSRVRQFQTLTHPDHLGRSFRVLVQARRRVG